MPKMRRDGYIRGDALNKYNWYHSTNYQDDCYSFELISGEDGDVWWCVELKNFFPEDEIYFTSELKKVYTSFLDKLEDVCKPEE